MGVPQSRPDSRPQSPCAPRCASCGRLAGRVPPWCSLGLSSNADRGVEKTSATACCGRGREESRWSSNGTPKQGGKGCARSWGARARDQTSSSEGEGMGPLGPCRNTAAISGKQACCETKKTKKQRPNKECTAQPRYEW